MRSALNALELGAADALYQPGWRCPPATSPHNLPHSNAQVFAERKASRACFGCTPAQLEAQGPIPHCKYHGQDASEAVEWQCLRSDFDG